MEKEMTLLFIKDSREKAKKELCMFDGLNDIVDKESDDIYEVIIKETIAFHKQKLNDFITMSTRHINSLETTEKEEINYENIGKRYA